MKDINSVGGSVVEVVCVWGVCVCGVSGGDGGSGRQNAIFPNVCKV